MVVWGLGWGPFLSRDVWDTPFDSTPGPIVLNPRKRLLVPEVRTLVAPVTPGGPSRG